MMVTKRSFLIWWIGGLVAFAGAIALHAPLITDAVPGGIIDHQAAPDAATVDAIHAGWKEAGVFGQATWAIISDLIFIVIYGYGAFLGGRYFLSKPDTLLRGLGWIVAIAAIIFLISDLGETGSQLIEVLNDAGSETLAMIASTLQGPKSVSFVVSFLGIAIALVLEPFRAPK
jgi:uncharacterized membrane protein